MNKRASIHNHSYFSNLRILDALPSPEDIVNQALALEIPFIGISDHESLSAHIRLNKMALSLQETNPNFKIGLGNEIYLTKNRDKEQTYYHFLLLAKDACGHQMLRQLSSQAWISSYFDRGLQRVPTLYSEIEDIIKKYGKGHLIASSACIGSMIGKKILEMKIAEENDNLILRKKAHDDIVEHVLFCKKYFGDDFYFEIAPALYDEQIYVNKKTLQLCDVFGIKATIQDDSHRLTQDDYMAHKALLNSKQGEREDIDKFYKYTYLQSYEDIRKNMEPVGCDCDKLFANSMEIYDKVETFSLLHPQQVPMVTVPDFPKKKQDTKYKFLDKMYNSDNPQERYWVNFCVNKLKEKNLYNDIYLTELDNEAEVQMVVGEKLNTCIFSYPIFLQHYFDLIWECKGCIGVGRGSSAAGLDNYLMGLTQYDCIKAGVNNYFRYLNKSRIELPDLDFDLPPTVRPKWFQKIREERGELGLIQVCTFSTMSSKASVLSSCRGYRSKDYPDGINNDEAQYIASLIGSERGFTYSISEMVYGDETKGLKPNKIFLNAVNKYPGLLDIIQKLEGTVSNRSIHASGVIFNDIGHEYDNGAIMTAPDGTLITQWSLHDAEAAGKVKIDSLVTDVMEKITQCVLLLQENGYIDKTLSLKDAYNKYLHPDVLPIEDEKIWDAIDNGTVHNLFQFDTQVGGQAVKKLKPRNTKELSAINALIRLMAQEKGAETPVDRYYRIKNNPNDWVEEMNSYGLTEEEQNILKEYCQYTYGTLPLQDDLMLMMMDERLFGFDLETTNSARKIIGKKLMNKIPELKKQVLDKAKSKNLGKYIWDVLFSEQLGYAFNAEHTYSYSLIGIQCAYLATHFPDIYWNTACLRVDAGLESDASSNYNKIAKAVGNMIHNNTKISLININKSGYMFEPDEESGSILYGLKALNGVNGELIEDILKFRSYESFEDFIERCPQNKTTMISLIKSGAFDCFADRKEIMTKYIWSICEPKKRITMQNFAGLMDRNLIPDTFAFEKQLFNFNKALRKFNKLPGNVFKIEDNGMPFYSFFEKYFDIDLLQPQNGYLVISEKVWKKLYDEKMAVCKKWITDNSTDLLDKLNNSLYREMWNKYAEGSISDWEMDSLGFYYHDHPLLNVNFNTYNIVNYNDLPEEPIVDYTFERNGHSIPIFKTFRICGTVIAKDDVKNIVSILTPDKNVVDVKFTREYYAKYKQQLSEIQKDGNKKVVEGSWFSRGTKIIVNGFRRGNMFVAKKYNKTNSHQLYKITNIYSNGLLDFTNARYGEEEVPV